MNRNANTYCQDGRGGDDDDDDEGDDDDEDGSVHCWSQKREICCQDSHTETSDIIT